MQIKQKTLNSILDQAARLDAENRALKFMLTKLQFAVLPAEDCCPICGGNRGNAHDSTCELAALIDPDQAAAYKELTGLDIVDALLFDLENIKDGNQ